MGNVQVASERLQVEFIQPQVQIAGERLAIEVRIPNVQVAGHTLQVEIDIPTITSRYKLWNGSSWATHNLKRYTGSWVDVSARTKFYNGSWQT